MLEKEVKKSAESIFAFFSSIFIFWESLNTGEMILRLLSGDKQNLCSLSFRFGESFKLF